MRQPIEVSMIPIHGKTRTDSLCDDPAVSSPGDGERAVPAPAATRVFYENQFGGTAYAHGVSPDVVDLIRELVDCYALQDKCVLEVGCGRGGLQGAVVRWVGVDLAVSAAGSIHKPFVCASAERLPFPDGAFDCVWSIHVLEHVVDLEAALREMARVLRPGGLLLLKPAWFCRPWAAQGYEVRPWSDFNWMQKTAKASIPFRNQLWYRLLAVAPKRLSRELFQLLLPRPVELCYRRLKANYEVFWQADSDACNSIDPHDIILWFASRGWQPVGRETLRRRLTVRTGALLFRKPVS